MDEQVWNSDVESGIINNNGEEMGRLGIVSKPKTEVTVEDLKRQFPSKKRTITEETAQIINDANGDPTFNGDEFMSTLIDYQNVMASCSGSMREYINAVKFCAYLEAESYNITEAYRRARSADDFVKARIGVATDSAEYKELTSAASRYHKTPMVRQILTQSDMPLYLMFQGARYQAVSVLADQMMNARFDKDRINAADKLLLHVKPPENVQIELDIGVKENSAVQQLNDQLAQLASSQKVHLEAGSTELGTLGSMKVRDSDILDAEVEDHE